MFSCRILNIVLCAIHSVQFSSVAQSRRTLRPRQASLSITNSRSSPKLMCIKLVMPSSHLILCRPLLLLPPISPTESKRLFYTSVSLLLSRIQGCHYHLYKLHIHVLIYCIGVFHLTYFTVYNRLQFHPPH